MVGGGWGSCRPQYCYCPETGDTEKEAKGESNATDNISEQPELWSIESLLTVICNHFPYRLIDIPGLNAAKRSSSSVYFESVMSKLTIKNKSGDLG